MMDWLNIHRSTLGAGEFLGCDPVQRATWLCLLAYCADQENGGFIAGAAEWGDRKWQQVVRITRDEAHTKCPLWEWIDGDLVVWSYPVEKEAEVRRNRENGGKGGRPTKPRVNQVVTSGLPSGLPSGVTETITRSVTQTEPSAPISAETERKGKERKGKGTEHTADAAEIYQLYPRKEARADAIRAIEKALRKVPSEVLKEAVEAFAKAQEGKQAKFIPHPASWFNAERWTDDRGAWSSWTEPTQGPRAIPVTCSPGEMTPELREAAGRL
jgi:hypothetical protein